ncbi:hypothetical protein PIB30_009761 [Stylosanthes scabra]|uniref:Uncharacterized protein n=1 Tax=Stylosanthes scabra TaxID=79078 RepID=A0ABU6X763_9FABA|nr:hypothetical protein [Stylosanthes scabra]
MKSTPEGTDRTVTEGYLPTHTNPSSSPDNKRGIKAFLRFAGSTLINIHQEEHGILLFLCASYLVYQDGDIMLRRNQKQKTVEIATEERRVPNLCLWTINGSSLETISSTKS